MLLNNRHATVNARVTDDNDAIVLTPSASLGLNSLVNAIGAHLPGLKLRRTGGSLYLSPQDAALVHSSPVSADLQWTPGAELFLRNRKKVQRAFQKIHREVQDVRDGGRMNAQALIADLEGLEVLDDHQVVNVAAMTLPDGYGLCVFDEQGAGKTVTGIYAFDLLVARDEVDAMLIVAPKSMVAEWPGDIKKFKSDLYKIQVVTGSPEQKRCAVGSGSDILITNFETAVSMEIELRDFLQNHQGRVVMMVDESFYIKNIDARRTRTLRRLREFCGRAFVLCGTPAPNSPQDLIQQFSLVDFGLTFEGVDIPKDRDEARPVIQEVIEQRGLFTRHLKADVLPDLPGKSFNRVHVPLQPIQRQLYMAALDNYILDLHSIDNATFQRQITSFLARRSALLQICSNPISVAENYAEVPAKLQALDQILEEAITKRGEKVVLWSFYTASINAMCARYGQFNPVRYDGVVSDIAVRREAVRSFQEQPETKLFIANPAAAGAGITLHSARLAIYESMSNQAAHYLQSLDRIHRRGQTRGVEYLILLCEKTIEIEEYQRLMRKEQAAQQLLGDRVSESDTRETLLAEAVSSQQLLGGIG